MKIDGEPLLWNIFVNALVLTLSPHIYYSLFTFATQIPAGEMYLRRHYLHIGATRSEQETMVQED
jgi:hypothetical protein